MKKITHKTKQTKVIYKFDEDDIKHLLLIHLGLIGGLHEIEWFADFNKRTIQLTHTITEIEEPVYEESPNNDSTTQGTSRDIDDEVPF